MRVEALRLGPDLAPGADTVLADVSVPTSFLVVAIIAIVLQSIVLVLALFDPGLRHGIDHAEMADMDPQEFLDTLEAVTDSQLSRRTRLDVCTNGEQFYEAELAAIRAARRTVLVVDGEVAFAGGAGIADHWLLERQQ